MGVSMGEFGKEVGGLSRRSFMKASLAAAGVACSPFLFRRTACAAGAVKARFMVGSDVHIPAYSSERKLAASLNWAHGLGRIPDRVCLVGDIVDNGQVDQYDALNAVIDAGPFSRESYIFRQGNHETFDPGVLAAPARFKEKMGQEANKLLSVNGVPVITMGPNGFSDQYYVGNYGFLEESLAAISADPETYTPGSPIFVLCHHSIQGTAYTSPEWNGNYGQGTGADLVALMASYPQIIHISGHSHATIEDARSIDQSAGFTCIQDSTLGAYFECERNQPHTMYDVETGEVSSYPAFNEEASQCLIVDVMQDNTVEVQRWNLYPLLEGGAPYQVFESWVVDVPDMMAGSPSYMPSRVSSVAPVVPADGEVTVDDIGEDAFTVHFPAFSSGSDENLDMLHDYLVTLTPVDEKGNPTGAAIERRFFSDYYRVDEKRHEYTGGSWAVRTGGLAPQTSYKVEVRAETSFADNGEAGVSESIGGIIAATGAAPEPPEMLLDIDYRYGVLNDAMGHEAVLFGGALVADDTMGSAAAKVFETDGHGGCRYALEATDYRFFKNASSTECFFKMVDVESDQCVFSNQQGAGAGFEVENGRLEFWLNLEGGRVMPAAPIEAGAWVHAVATHDGTTAKLYISGELADEVPGAGALSVPGPKTYFVCSDTSSAMEPEFMCASGTRVALARLYPRCLTPEEVAARYAQASAVSHDLVDAATGVKASGVALDASLKVADTSDAPRAELAEADVLIGSYDVTLLDTTGTAVQPLSPIALTLPVIDGWARSAARVEVFHSDGARENLTATVSPDNTVVLEGVSKLSQFDIVAGRPDAGEGGDTDGSGDGQGGVGNGTGDVQGGGTGGLGGAGQAGVGGPNGGGQGASGGTGQVDAATAAGQHAGSSVPKTADTAFGTVAAGVVGVAGAAATAAYAFLRNREAEPLE